MRFSNDVRLAILELHKKKNCPKQIVRLLNNEVSASAVYKIIKKYKHTGSVKDRKRRRAGKFTIAMESIVKETYDKSR